MESSKRMLVLPPQDPEIAGRTIAYVGGPMLAGVVELSKIPVSPWVADFAVISVAGVVITRVILDIIRLAIWIRDKNDS